MRVLVVGGGAREHALAARLAAEHDVDEVIAAPGNPGIERVARVVPVDAANTDELVSLARRAQIDLTVVGPELPLSLGIVDRFRAAGRFIVGPTRAAAALESSKAFAKAFLARHGVPTARFQIADTLDAALRVIASRQFAFPLVLKADGLAAGKGVVIADDERAAREAVVAAMRDKRFGAAGERLVIEECLTGTELSFFAVADGMRAIALGSAEDHKRIFDDDRGPNTGGMGALAPSPLVDDALERRIMREIVDPVMAGMASDGHSYTGFLYAGLMLTASGPKVIEFNVRLGDPEAQVVLPLVDQPLLPLLTAAATGSLGPSRCRLGREKIVGVVMASRGYPESAGVGHAIDGIERAEAIPGVSVYHAGVARRDGRLVTAGGRVLTVVGRGADFSEATLRAYAGVMQISFEGMQYRRDIGRRAIAHEDNSQLSTFKLQTD
jgi:phosphoribosylamine--glycine ligase